MNKKGLTAVLLLCLFYNGVSAQILHNNVNVHSAYFNGTFTGEEVLSDNGFVMPSLFSNYEKSEGLLVSVSNRIYSFMCLGLTFMSYEASNWQYKNLSDYRHSVSKKTFFAPQIKFNTPQARLGIRNRLSLFIGAAPGLGVSKLTLEYPLVAIQNQDSDYLPPLSESNIYYGIKTTIGTNIILHPRIGVFLAYAQQHNRIKGSFFINNRFTTRHLEFGLLIRLAENKQIYQ